MKLTVNKSHISFLWNMKMQKCARMVTESIAELAGEFVVASAGPDLESLLPGKGSGAALSQNEQIISE